MKKDIKQIIAEGESQQTEFKSSFNVEAMESITAFANTEGGCVLVGVSKHATELATKHATISRQYFSKLYIRPAFNIGLIAIFSLIIKDIQSKNII